jgi:hypothetical protein
MNEARRLDYAGVRAADPRVPHRWLLGSMGINLLSICFSVGWQFIRWGNHYSAGNGRLSDLAIKLNAYLWPHPFGEWRSWSSYLCFLLPIVAAAAIIKAACIAKRLNRSVGLLFGTAVVIACLAFIVPFLADLAISVQYMPYPN